MYRSIGIPEIFVVFVLLFAVVPFWKIFSKAGYPGIMSLTMFVPILNVVMIFFLGFSDWPVLKELSAMRQRTPPSI
jgi:hypothetical protein